ncbi:MULTISPECIES: type IX secretion system membrane protein PorP/SprF [unclassified Lentimicrobium]|uniref:PorP/SprF family type IX secretion system membrane protein n=1 Tax=unclassified Lentimicrobium TaxID=2677434 RepID=UPI0015539E06|nr:MULTISPECIES: type IX secretion system membrane protein PorP/SprF [unclassified Lentimicrobium]NPD47798.1 type IX secretion system membrane protein PorP/SprF [Lentimicrobium sp. S6]NPD86816.1 type IX secretion system membrane protein PorP/SprF [Lentimicrobium sp. L6]
MKKILILGVLLLLLVDVKAQQEAMYTHYSFNTLSINPAYAGTRDALTMTGLHRSMWVGFPGAPKTQTFTAHSPVFHENIGLGLTVVNDQIGPTQQTSFSIDYAFRIKVGENAKLSFGLKSGLSFLSNDLSRIHTTEENDPVFQSDYTSDLLPIFGFGLYYYTPKFYAGLSVPRLIKNDFFTNTTYGGVKGNERHYFFIAGAIFSLTSDGRIKLKPTTYIKVSEGAPIEMDLTALFYINDVIWVGPMFRTGDAVGGLAGINITKQLSVGYSFDWSYANTTSKYNDGSHEIMLRYDFIFKDKGKISSPRYF